MYFKWIQPIPNWLFIHFIQYFNKSVKKKQKTISLLPPLTLALSRLFGYPKALGKWNFSGKNTMKINVFFHSMGICSQAFVEQLWRMHTHRRLQTFCWKTSRNENVRQQLIIFFNCQNYFSLYFKIDYILYLRRSSANTIIRKIWNLCSSNHKFICCHMKADERRKRSRANACIFYLFKRRICGGVRMFLLLLL